MFALVLGSAIDSNFAISVDGTNNCLNPESDDMLSNLSQLFIGNYDNLNLFSL